MTRFAMNRFARDTLLWAIFFAALVLLAGCGVLSNTVERDTHGYVCDYPNVAEVDTFPLAAEAYSETKELPPFAKMESAPNCTFEVIGSETVEINAALDCYPVTHIGPNGNTYVTETCY